MTLGKSIGPFSRCGRVKANDVAKELNITNKNAKERASNCTLCLALNSSFF